MAASLKGANVPRIAMVLIANLLVFHLLLTGSAITDGDLETVLTKGQQLAPVGLVLALVAILNAVVDSNTKARLVFWRWSDPLPGSEAFSHHGPADPRVDMAAIESNHGPLPTAAGDQNTLWYRLYKSVKQDASVDHVHGDFLFARDYAVMSLLMIVGLGGLGFLLFPSKIVAAFYLGSLFAQYLVVRQAASNLGRRFVCTVLAIIGTG